MVLSWRTRWLAIFIVFVSATAFAAIRFSVSELEPGAVAYGRFAISAAALLVAAPFLRLRGVAPWDLLRIGLLGLTGFTGYTWLLARGTQSVDSGVAALIVSASPVLVGILATFAFHERIRRTGWLTMAVSLVGVGLISVDVERLVLRPGAAFVFAAMVCQATYFTFVKSFSQRYGPITVTAWAVWLGHLPLWFQAPQAIPEILRASPPVLLTLLYLGAFHTLVAYVGWAKLIPQLGAARATNHLFLVPAFALFIGWLFLGEIPSTTALVGGGIVLASVFAFQRFGQRPGRSSRSKNALHEQATPPPPECGAPAGAHAA